MFVLFVLVQFGFDTRAEGTESESHSPSLGVWDQTRDLFLVGRLPAGVWELLPFPELHHTSPLTKVRNRHFLAQGAADQLQEEGEQLWIQVSDMSPR